MPHIHMGTKPDSYIMFCPGIGVVIQTPMPHIDMGWCACAGDVGTVYVTLSR